jgi:hypothetical protein
MFLKKIKAHDFLQFLMIHIIIKMVSPILILCMIENLFKTFLTYNK